MAKTSEGLVKFAKLKLGTPYVYGAKGELLTPTLYKQLKQRYGSMVWATDEKKVGKICVDCSGLISWYTGKVMNSTAYKDTATKVLPISKIEEAVEGCAVWRQGHIGIYIGNGEIIEARGSSYGVVKTKVKDRDFTHVLWLSDIAYTEPKESGFYPKTTYTGVSLVEGLKAVGIDSSFSNREKIALANGISNYKGTASQNTKLLTLLKNGKLLAPNDKKLYYPKTAYKGVSLVEGLKSVGVDSSFSSRKKIAKANGIKAYVGLASQNTKLLNLLKQGKLVKP